jgi:hypothetical protein
LLPDLSSNAPVVFWFKILSINSEFDELSNVIR